MPFSVRQIKGYEGFYTIDCYGNIYSEYKQRYLKPSLHPSGYYRIQLYKNKTPQGHRIHRLVAEHFIDNPKNHESVDHIDRDPTNNHVLNLRWASRHTQQLNRQVSIDSVLPNHMSYEMNKGKRYIRVECVIKGKQYKKRFLEKNIIQAMKWRDSELYERHDLF